MDDLMRKARGLLGLSGVGFGKVLALRERRHTVEELSPARAARWGVLGSVAVPLLFGALGFFDSGTTAIDVLQAMAVTGTLGGVFAAGSVAIAQRARLEPGDPADRLEPMRTTEPDRVPAARGRIERR